MVGRKHGRRRRGSGRLQERLLHLIRWTSRLIRPRRRMHLWRGCASYRGRGRADRGGLNDDARPPSRRRLPTSLTEVSKIRMRLLADSRGRWQRRIAVARVLPRLRTSVLRPQISQYHRYSRNPTCSAPVVRLVPIRLLPAIGEDSGTVSPMVSTPL